MGLSIYTDLLGMTLMHCAQGNVSQKVAFKTLSATLATLERKLLLQEMTEIAEFRYSHRFILGNASRALEKLSAPTEQELNAKVDELVENLDRFCRGSQRFRVQGEYDELLSEIDETLCAGVMVHRFKKRIALDLLATQTKAKVLALPQVNGVYTFANEQTKYPWNIVVNDTDVFGVWKEITARGKVETPTEKRPPRRIQMSRRQA